MKVVRPNLTSSERLHERLAAARLAVPDQWHFLTEAVMQRLRAELGAAGVVVDLSDGGDPNNEDRRFIAVSE